MRHLTTFIMGMATGGALLYGALHYHLIRANDGFHLVPKLEHKLAATYVDIRSFTAADWAKHADIAGALMDANQGQLIEGSATDALRNGVDQLLNRIEQR